MAAKGAFPIRVENNIYGFGHVLKSAACEWLLLFLLLLDAAFSYFLTKFAEYCELQVPCILCSRLDHILGKENSDFYQNLLCSSHKLEISSLFSCHNHGKLVDVHGMCEECILSFAKNETNEETYRILVAKLGSDCLQKPLLNLDSGFCSLTTKFCSCCSKPWRSRPNVQKFVQSRPSTPVSRPDIPLPIPPGLKCLNCQQVLRKRRDRLSLATTPFVLGSADYDSLSHVGYTEVKIRSDSDSDFSISDEDESVAIPRNLSPQGSKIIPNSQYDDVFPSVQFSTPAKNNLMFLHLEPEKGETTTPRFQLSNGDMRQGNGQINLQHIVKKVSPAVAQEIGSLDDIPLATSAAESSSAIYANKGHKVSLSNSFSDPDFSDFISHKSALPSINLQLPPARLTKQKGIKTRELGDPGPSGHASAANNWESFDLNSTSTNPIRKNVTYAHNNSTIIGAKDLASRINKDVKALSIFTEKLSNRNFVEEPTAPKTIDSQKDSSLSNALSTMNGYTGEPQKVESTKNSTESQFPSKNSNSQKDLLLSNINSTMNGHKGERQKVKRSSSSTKSQMPPKTSDSHKDQSSSSMNITMNGSMDKQQKVESSSSPTESQMPEISDFHKDPLSSSMNFTMNYHADEPEIVESTSSFTSQMPPKTSDSHNDPSSSNMNSTMNGHMYEPHKIKDTISSIESQMPPKSPQISDSKNPLSSSNIDITMNGHMSKPQKVQSTSSSVECQMPPQSPKMEQSHSLESLDESVSEIEGESLVDQLRRQVEYDKERINSLYQELEEERNAAAIAANQAMAMITKLQEEKAALNMEALQYLRMMEEQAEYDVDMLEKANDMIAEKEKEIQDLEAELDYFRVKYPEDFPELNVEILNADETLGSHGESIETENS